MTRPMLAILFCATAVGFAAAESLDRHFEHSFDVQPGAILHLQHGDGDVTIEPWDQDRIEVTVDYHFELKGWRLGGEKGGLEVHFREAGNHFYVEEERERGGVVVIGASINREYIYTINAPSYVQLQLEGEDGDVEISEWAADVDVLTDDGDIRLSDCSNARFDLQLADGDLRVNRCVGQFDVELDDGDVEFRRVETQVLQLVGQDGDVDLDLIGAGAVDWDIELDDGDLTLEFDGDLDADIELETDDGRIRTSGFVVEGRQREHRVSAEIGQGEGRIRVLTEDGAISLRMLGGGS